MNALLLVSPMRMIRYELSWRLSKALTGPLHVNIDLTYRCNLRCVMCDVWRKESTVFGRAEDELTTEELKRFILEFHALGVRVITFAGGEPLLRRDIFDVLGFAKAQGMIVTLVTNGTLISREAACKLAKLKLDYLTVSLDATSPLLNDEMRGQGSFRRAVDATRMLREINMETKITLNTVVSRLNYKEMPQMPVFAAELGVSQVSFQPVFCKPGIPMNILTPTSEVYPDLRATVVETLEAGRQNHVHVGPVEYLSLIASSPYVLSFVLSRLNCYMVHLSCAVNAFGDVLPCWFLPALGNVRRTAPREIWFSEAFDRVRRAVKRHKVPQCERCVAACYTPYNILISKFRNPSKCFANQFEPNLARIGRF